MCLCYKYCVWLLVVTFGCFGASLDLDLCRNVIHWDYHSPPPPPPLDTLSLLRDYGSCRRHGVKCWFAVTGREAEVEHSDSHQECESTRKDHGLHSGRLTLYAEGERPLEGREQDANGASQAGDEVTTLPCSLPCIFPCISESFLLSTFSVTDNSVEPLRASLSELEQAVTDQLDLIAAVKRNILDNDEKISKMLSSVAKS